ncbi:MAG: energy-coupling factor ABC transporter ATP-binding protein [Desulfovibrionales bacterium]|nr:energy-coupling factor ABC transporter ATP-binding protein [Desulfovibrionales bacterium]
MSEPSLFTLEDVYFAYPPGQEVLRGVNLSFSSGQQIGLYGSNGSGKTTLFHVITGLVTPVQGRVLFHGRPVHDEKGFRALRREIGLVLQNAEDQLFNPTVLDDVAFGPLNLGLSADDARDRAVETLHALGLTGFEDRLTHRLSGGEKKLVSLATILSMQPKVLLLDEPTNGLDPQTRARIIEILCQLPTSRIIISHDWDFLAQTTTEYMTIKEGRLVSDAPFLPHRHVHAHPLGDEPHHHHD